MNEFRELSNVVLDFDGTCTQIPVIWEKYLELYLKGVREAGFDVADAEWREAQDAVRRHSPRAGWTLVGCPAAPAAADPYILADESIRLILRRRKDQRSVPAQVNAKAYAEAPAPWREDALDTFASLLDRGVRLTIISNSSTTKIMERLQELLGNDGSLSGRIAVQSDAGKFRICEPAWDDQSALPGHAIAKFEALPAAVHGSTGTGRPIYLRRGAYFEAIHRAFEGDLGLLPRTVFCGDIWEMDLAMPHALGANVHLLDRARPFDTYDYERHAVAACGTRGRASVDLAGLLDWF